MFVAWRTRPRHHEKMCMSPHSGIGLWCVMLCKRMNKRNLHNNINPPKTFLDKQQGNHDTTRGEEEWGCMGDMSWHLYFEGTKFLFHASLQTFPISLWLVIYKHLGGNHCSPSFMDHSSFLYYSIQIGSILLPFKISLVWRNLYESMIVYACKWKRIRWS